MLPKNTVGSKQIKKEAVTPAKLSKTSKATLTGPKGATGVQGPQGVQGIKGEAGAAATSLLAHVAANGTLITGTGVTKGELIFPPGAYEVVFNRDVSGCNCLAALAEEEAPGSVIVEPRGGEPDGVYVETTDPAGNDTDLPFYLAVFCP
jgi:hypothetical protein